MTEVSDVSALVENLTHEELALMVALQIRASGAPSVVIQPDRLGMGMPVVTSVTRTESPDGLTQFEITARDPQRESGYYLVYDPAYVRDVVAYWDDAKGKWLTSHLPTAELAGIASSDARVCEKITMPSA